MALSNDLVSKFVKLATNDVKREKKETTVYGTVSKIENGQVYVKLDGAVNIAEGSNKGTWTELPITDTVEVSEGNRVIVMIKNHSAIITANLSTPSANKTTTKDIYNLASNADKKADNNANKLIEFGVALGEKVDTKELTAEIAAITELETERFNTHQAKIDELQAEDVKIYGRLEAAEGRIEELDTEYLTAEEADIKYAKIGELEGTYAKITDLDTTNANVGNLDADLAEINTLIFGSATGKVVQAEFANQVIAHIGTAQIKDAMIDSVSAAKLTALNLLAGTINSDNVNISSSDGRMQIADNTIQIKDANRVRVQIGKDAAGDYSINIYDANGNIMFSEGGITDKAIKSAIIRNDMVANDANIHASKLDIDSLFEEINSDGTNVIKSTKITVDEEGQTLDAAFKKMATTESVDNLSKTVSSQGTQIQANTEAISTKVWQQDINTAKNEMSTQYSTLEQDLNSFKTTVGNTYSTKEELASLEIGGRNLALLTDATYTVKDDIVKLNLSEYGKEVLTVGRSVTISFDVYSDEDTAMDFYIRGGSGAVSNMAVRTVPTTGRHCVSTLTMSDEDPRTVAFRCTTAVSGYVSTNVYVRNVKVELGNQETDWTLAPEDVDSRISTAETAINQNISDISLRATKTELNSALEEIDNVSNNLETNYYTRNETESKIKIANDSITSTVSATYATKAAVSDVNARIDNQRIGGRNLVLNSEGEVSFTNLVYSYNLSDYAATNGTNASFVVSFDMRTNEVGAGCDVYLRYIKDGSGTGIGITVIDDATDEYKRYTLAFNTGDIAPTMFAIRTTQYTTSDYHSGTATFYVKNVKAEFGTVATDWTPAPEDMATGDELETMQSSVDLAEERITTAETLIQQLSDSISMLVTDGNGESLMTQTEKGWTFSTDQIQGTVNTISENLNALTNEVGDVNSTVGILQQAVDDLGVLGEYIQITTYEDEPCIELGELDSDFKLRITNTRMMFTEGSVVLAYFTNQSFHSKKVVVEEELQQGGFVWKARANGNLGLVWKGGNS